MYGACDDGCQMGIEKEAVVPETFLENRDGVEIKGCYSTESERERETSLNLNLAFKEAERSRVVPEEKHKATRDE